MVAEVTMASVNPMSVSIQTITMGNVLAITPEDTPQLVIIGVVSLGVLLAKWKDLMRSSLTRTMPAQSASDRHS